jgi:cell division protein FtsW (lipid II flippase)
MRKKLYDICYISTLLLILLSIVSLYSESLFFLETLEFIVIKGVFLLLSFILFFKCICIWKVHDKKSHNIIMLIFLHIFFLLFYYPRIRRNNWL